MPDKRYIIIFCIVVLLTFILSNTFAAKWELSSFDHRIYAAKSIKKLNEKIAILGIDDEALRKFGQWPWRRDIHAKIVDKLLNLKAKTIAYDILFEEPDLHGAQYDKIFAQSINKSKIVILPFKFIKEDNMTGAKIIFPIPILEKSAAALGFVDMIYDIDGIVRRTALAFRHNDIVYPSIDLAVYAFTLGVDIKDIQYLDKKIVVGTNIIHTDKNYMVYINFAENKIAKNISSDVFRAASLSKIFEFTEKKDTIYKSKICLIGATAEGFKDYFVIPSGYISGVAVHANILNMLLEKKFIIHVSFIYEIIMWLLLGIITLFIFPRLKFWESLALFLFISVLYTTANFILFSRGYYITLISPMIFLFLSFAFAQGYQFMRTRNIFGQFLAQEIVDNMLKAQNEPQLGGEEKEVTILFSDIRGYTNLSEKMKPQEIMNLLNEYHNKMGKIFASNKGTIFDYQGDAQMVVFGAPIKEEDHAYLALRAADLMQKEISMLKKLHEKEIPEFNVGIGICTGKVAIGLVGAQNHKQYAAIGDATNVASRLQGLSGQLGFSILITESTYKFVQNKVAAKKLENIIIKGKSEPMNVYGVTDVS